MIRVNRFLLLSLASVSFLFFASFAHTQQYSENLYQELRWRMIGPFRGGRTRAVAGMPSQPNVFYMGAVDGGVWKSDDYGRTWNPIFDQQPTQSIGAIAVAPSNPKIIYVASGEGLQRPDLSVGDGIYKSTDAGATWTHLGLREGQQIPALAVDPHNPNRLFAAVLGHPYGANPERGIFRSADGGTTWQKVLYKDENTGGSDVEIDPSNPDVVYAALWQSRLGPWEDNNAFAGPGGGLFKSIDGGTTWRKLTKGLPDDLVQINLAIAASQPSRLYATLATTNPTSYASDKGLGFFRSDDAGESWVRITNDPRPAMKIGGGDLAIPRVDPQNPAVVYSASLVTVRSADGGKTWTGIRGAPGGDDYQNLWINPERPNIILLVADQGAIVTVNGGETWSSWYNQPTAQLYHASVANTFPYKVCGGQQESGSVCISSRGNDGEIAFRDWHPVGVIEYGYVAPDPLDSDIVYGAGRNEVSRFHWSTGQSENITPIPIRGKYRVDRTEPLLFSPIDPHILYYAANVLFETRDSGKSWRTISPDLTREDPGVPPSVGDQALLNTKAGRQRGAIYALAPSFKNVNTLWAGTDDGQVWITRDTGKNWKNITPPALTGWSKVTQISASHFDDETAYVSVSRFRIDDLRPYIYRTHNGGKTWQEITSGLPADAPSDTVREDPVRKGLLFAGTETSVWLSFDDGDHWQSLQLNLPHTAMRDLWINDDDLIVATHGRSFWILDDINSLRQITAGENPPDGTVIDYFLGKPSSQAVTLEILDSQGKLIRRYSSVAQPEQTQAALEKQLIPLYWLSAPKNVSTEKGMHRWIWDLRYPAPLSTEHEYPIAAVAHKTPRYPLGPLVLAGQYSARLTTNGHSYTANFAVKMDPRVKTSPEGLRKQFDLEMQLSSAITQSSEAVFQARSVREQLQKIVGASNEALKGSIKALDEEISVVLDGPKDSTGSASAAPALGRANSNLIALYKEVEKADVEPTVAQSEAFTRTADELAATLKQWNELKNTELAALNRQLSASGMPEVRLDLRPPQPESGANEE